MIENQAKTWLALKTWLRLLILIAGFTAFASLSLFSSVTHAASSTLRTPGGGSVIINAKEASRDYDRQIIELKGNVQLVYNQQYLSCDHAVIHLDTQLIDAEGNLVISSPQAYVEGDRATMSYRDQTGVIMNGFVKSGQVLLDGSVIRKIGPEEYEAEHAYYTACTTCPTAWSFKGDWIHAQMGGYAHIKRPILEIANLPVLWLPYLIVPLKSERQTGLLIPSFDFSGSGGAAITFRYFWAISRSQDATFGLKTYSKRGWKGLVNYRYMLSNTSAGELDAGFFPSRDRVFEQELSALNQPVGSRSRRWFVSYGHTYDLPNDFMQKTKINFVSDLRYPRDFSDEIVGAGDPALENRISLTRNTEMTHSSLDTSYYINQLKANPLDSNRDAVHRFPELRYAWTERPIGDTNLLFHFSTDYVNFAREDYGFDDVYLQRDDQNRLVLGSDGRPIRLLDATRTQEGGGVFDPSIDVIRAGQRIDLQPELSYPIQVGPYLDLLPVAQFRHTQYYFDVTPPEGSVKDVSPYRQYLSGSVSARTHFFRVYGEQPPLPPPAPPPRSWVDSESRAAKNADGAEVVAPAPPSAPKTLYRHEVTPEIVFNDVPYVKQTENPFFGKDPQLPIILDAQPVSDSDFQSERGLQFDYNDRFTNRNTVSFVLNNTLVRKNIYQNGSQNYKQIASLKLAQSYDFDEAQRSNRATFPWSDISALIDLRFEHLETNTLFRYYPYHNVTNTSSRLKVMDDKGDFLQLSLAQTFQISQDVNTAWPGRTENVSLAAGFDKRYLAFSGTIDYTPVAWMPPDFKAKSWSMLLNFKPPGDCWGIRTSISQNLFTQEVLYKIDFDYKFGGANI